jgi:hypothetical protein
MNKIVTSARRFFQNRKKNETGIVKGSGRKVTDWSAAQKDGKHSILWLIEHAVTVEMLQDVLKFANYQTNAQPDTRRAWADAAEKRMFILKRRPPTYEPVPFEEYMELAGKVLDLPTFQKLRQKELMMLAAGSAPADDKNFLPVAKDGPVQAPMSMDIQTAIDAAEVPRYVAPEVVKAREQKGRLALYSDGVSYSAQASSTVTEVRLIARRQKCPPFHSLALQAVPTDESERVYNEWDVLFFCGETNVTRQVVKESHPDTMRQSRTTVGAAVFSAMHGDGIAPILWIQTIEKLTDRKIIYNDKDYFVPSTSSAAPKSFPGSIAKTLAELDARPALHTD